MTSGVLKCLLVHRRDLREPLWLSRSCVCVQWTVPPGPGRSWSGSSSHPLPVRCEKPAYWNQKVITHTAHSVLLWDPGDPSEQPRSSPASDHDDRSMYLVQAPSLTNSVVTLRRAGAWDPVLQCGNACSWTHLSSSNKIQRNYMGLKITACMPSWDKFWQRDQKT